MDKLNKAIDKLDHAQQKNRFFGFLHAVVKKYNDDRAGVEAALLTYYAFLALFPLLMALTTITGYVARNNPELYQTVIEGMTSYFPVLGNQLSERVNSLHKTGAALIIGLLLSLYGARGVADAFRNGVNHVWGIPVSKRDGFPKDLGKNIAIILLGGMGLLTASLTASMAANAGSGIEFTVMSLFMNLFLLFWSFIIILNLSLPKHVSLSEVRAGAATAALGLVTMQAIGGIVLKRYLKNLDALYSNFAITLGLLFWLYLQSQIIYIAVEIAYVRAKKAYPRSLNGNNPTPTDKKLQHQIDSAL